MYTKFDKDMYIILKCIDNYISLELGKSILFDKYNYSENYVNFIIEEACNNSFIDGIKVEINSETNTKYIVNSDNVYITRKGQYFIKEYKLRIWKKIQPILLMILTAIVTSIITTSINNELAEETQQIICDCNPDGNSN